MSNSEFQAFSSGNGNIPNYAQGTPVKIVKGSLKGCRGAIAGCTSNGVYFISSEKCDTEADQVFNPIGLFLPEEFELADR